MLPMPRPGKKAKTVTLQYIPKIAYETAQCEHFNRNKPTILLSSFKALNHLIPIITVQ